MKGLLFFPLLLSTLSSGVVSERIQIRDNADLDDHLVKRQIYPRGYEHLNAYAYDDAFVPEKIKRDVPADVEAALKLVRAAQVGQGKKNRKQERNPRRPQFKLRPVEDRKGKVKSNRKGKNNNVLSTYDDGVDDKLSAAAALVAEFEAPSYNTTLPDLGHDFPKFEKRQAGAFWMEGVAHGAVGIGGSAGYQVFRNVKDFGAVGDGLTDDTAAINLAISSGERCGDNCGSSTIKPALVYFPSGTYLVSKSIIGYYNTQIVGNPKALPIIRAASSFIGLGVISSNVYIEGASGGQWYINQNNFMRQVRNFIIDMRAVPNRMEGQDIAPAGIHWQVAQATSLYNIQVIMSSRTDTTHMGIFMENGSGGFMSDMSFSGGKTGAYLGNQQFTIRKFSFNGCKVAVNTHWNWALSAKSFLINNCGIGFNVSAAAGSGQGTGSIIIMDSTIMNTPIGVTSVLTGTNRTSLLIDNLQLINVPTAVVSSGQTVLAGGTTRIDTWGAGLAYDVDSELTDRGAAQIGGAVLPGLRKPAVLLGENGWYERSKPQYESLPASSFYDVKARGGARGNGRNDDTAAINSALQAATAAGQITYFPHGMYVVTDTIFIPSGAKIVGEAWSQIQASGARFSDRNNPRVVVRVGNRGDVGTLEMQDMLFGVRGGTAGAILMEWNIKASDKGTAAIWDSHWRIGGSVGSNLQRTECPKLTGSIKPECICATLLLHLTRDSSGYFENMWVWTADHDLDILSQDQIDIYVGRGVLIESQGPVWMYGTASEHNVLYQYQLQDAKNIFMALIQTESPYFQTAPTAPLPFTYIDPDAPVSRRDLNFADNVTALSPHEVFVDKRQATNMNAAFRLDPGFGDCQPGSIVCAVSWAVRVLKSSDINIYGGGLYSWFQNYDQTCLQTSSCQWNVAQIDGQTERIRMNNLVTVGSSLMVRNPMNYAVGSQKTRNGFASSALAIQAVRKSGGTFGDDGNPSEDTPEGRTGAIEDSGLLIVSTSRIPPDEEMEPDLSNQKKYWEAYQVGPGDEISCTWFDNHHYIGNVRSPQVAGVFGSYLGPPRELSGIRAFGQNCRYKQTVPDDTEWLFYEADAKYGEMTCAGFSGTFDCYKVGGQAPRIPDTYCGSNFWFIEGVICPLKGYHSFTPRHSSPLNPKDITPYFFQMHLRNNRVHPGLPFYEESAQLFYTRRLARNHWEGRPGLSERARNFAARARLMTIWEGWPSVMFDGPTVQGNDFYGINDSNNFLANIVENPPPHTNGQFQYFTEMSREFARQASGTVYVMTEDPANTVMQGIWGDTEYTTLVEDGRTWVSRIIAVDLEGGNPHLIFTRMSNEGRPTPRNPIRWTRGLPWGAPITDLPPDDAGPPRPPNTNPKKRSAGVYERFERARDAFDRRDENVTERSTATPEKRQLSYELEYFDYGNECLEWYDWESDDCPYYSSVFSPLHYEKRAGRNAYRDFFG